MVGVVYSEQANKFDTVDYPDEDPAKVTSETFLAFIKYILHIANY